MKRFVCPLFLFLLACASASAQLPGDDCLNNCGDYPGDCAACHNTSKAAAWFADFTYVCPPCATLEAKTQPTVPFVAKPTNTVLAFLESLTVKKDPKLVRLLAMTPEKHIALMERAARLKLDGPMLGNCRKAFRVGTLERLPAEIEATRKRLIVAQTFKP